MKLFWDDVLWMFIQLFELNLLYNIKLYKLLIIETRSTKKKVIRAGRLLFGSIVRALSTFWSSVVLVQRWWLTVNIQVAMQSNSPYRNHRLRATAVLSWWLQAQVRMSKINGCPSTWYLVGVTGAKWNLECDYCAINFRTLMVHA